MIRIPKFKTEKEICDFWDTHDLTDYMDELKVEYVEVVAPRRNIQIRLKPRSLEKIRMIAKVQHISSSKLIENCIEQGLKSLRAQ